MQHGETSVRTVDPMLDPEGLTFEMEAFMAAIKIKAGKMSTEEFWRRTLTNPTQRETFPNFCALARIAFSFPSTSVENERDFSFMNLNKSELRNRLGEINLNAVARLVRSGYSVSSFPYKEALHEWGKLPRRNA